MPAAEPGRAPGEGPLSDDEIAALFGPLEGARGLALAVSGGADSLALMVAADRWRQGRTLAVTVLTVDHGLRPEAADEAAMVAAAATARGLAARVLRRDGPTPTSDIEAAARRARYRLLLAAARAAGASHLATAHHRDDVAEGFVMRLGRGAGVFGLAAMRPLIDADGVMLARPFLTVPRARLAATTAAAGLTPADDAMNRDPRYARARARALLPLLATEGLDAGALAEAAGRLADAAGAIDAAADTLIAAAAGVDDLAVVTLRRGALAEAPAAVRYRVLTRVLMAAGGTELVPRFARLEALADALLAGEGADGQRSLGGVLAERAGETLRFTRETGREGLPDLPLADGVAADWDGRYRVTVAGAVPPGTVLGALGEAGRRAIGAKGPQAALAALPAVRVGGEVRMVPAIGFTAGEALPVEVRQIVAARLARPPLFPDFGADG